MKRIYKTVLGVTLLEVMLVLAIAAMIIVMSIRYYQSASQSQQANQAMEQVQAIAATFDTLAIGPGSYSGVTSANIESAIGAANMNGPSGGAIAITSISATGYSVSIPVGTAACSLAEARMSTNTKLTSLTCTSAGVLTYTYDNTQ